MKRNLPAPVVSAARPLVRGAVYGLHRSRQTVNDGRKRVRRLLKDFFLRHRLSSWGPAFFTALARVRAPRDEYRRRHLARHYAARVNGVLISEHTSYALISPTQVTRLDEVLRACRTIFDAKAGTLGAVGERDTDRKRGFLRNLLTNEDLARHPELVEFALSDALLAPVTRYLGTIPHLNRIDLLYSVPRTGEGLEASQLFHLDPEGLSQAKVFVNVYDVGDAEGPFTFIPADQSRRLVQAISARRAQQGVPVVGRYTDEEIAELGGSSAIIEVRGDAGTGVIVDTSRCLHCGSRVRPGSFRLCLYIQYCTSREQGNVFDIERFAGDPIRYLAVKASRLSAGTKVSAPHQM